MATIQVILDDELLAEADRAARKAKVNRSALLRTALRDYLERRQVAAWEDQERRAYAKQPIQSDDVEPWLPLQVWPED